MNRLPSPIVLLWLTGVLAAAQLGKITALGPALRSELSLTLPALGWLISLLEVGGALFGFVAGLVLGRVGTRRMLLAGLMLLAVTGTMEVLAPRIDLLFLARGIEGIGYLLVVISAPTMIVSLTQPGPERDKAIALWSSFVPVGVGAGTAITGLAAGLLGARATMLGWALLSLGLLAALARYRAPTPARRGRACPAPAAWLLSLGFGCYTLFLCALTGLLPLFLLDRHGVATTRGSALAGGIVLAALPGTGLSLALLGRPLSLRRRLSVLSGVLIVASLLAPLIFLTRNLVACAGLAGLLLLLAGMARTLIFTRLPALSGGKAADDARLASAQGLLTQCGAGGALLGPPLGAQIVQSFGWSALGVLIGLLVLVLLACLVGADMSDAMSMEIPA